MGNRDRQERVFALAEDLVLRHARAWRQRSLLLRALRGVKRQTDVEETPPFICVPLDVYAAVRGDEAPALPLAAAATLLFTGIDLLDDMADGDLARSWGSHSPAEIQLCAATLLSSLPQLAVAELDAPPAVRDALQRCLAQGLLRMSAGQQQDLSFAGGSSVRAAEVEASVAGKSGEEVAMWARLAAELAQAAPDRARAYEDMGRALGTGGQLASDCHDLFQSSHGRDLRNGARTLPIAMHLERSRGAERAHFLRLLERARTSASARKTARRRLLGAGELRRCAMVVELYCQRALSCLREARPREPAAERLRALIKRTSFFEKKKQPEGVSHEPRIGGEIDGPLAVGHGVPR